MKTSIKHQGAFSGKSIRLTNITVKKYNGGNILQYMIFKGKGTGSQLTMTSDYEKVLSFDDNFKALVYKTIFAIKDGRMGGAWFLNDEIFFPNEHPFVLEGGYTFKQNG